MECNDKIKFTSYAIIETKKWNEIIKQIEMKKPNPNLRNTAIYVGNDEQLRKRAIEYYESEGYPFEQYRTNFEYIGTFDDNSAVSDFNKKTIKTYNYTIIILPEPEPEPEPKYPCMMTLVGCDGLDFIDVVQGVFLGKYMVKDPNDDKMFHAFDVAKPLPTTTITTEELIEFYEKNTNTKVILSN
jgi:hypothetical protein